MRVKPPGPALALLAAVPLVGVLELVLHVHQVRDVVRDEDWGAARDAVVRDVKPDDLVTFAPFWSDPLGRRWFGADLMTLERAGRSDEARFARAWEVSIRGAHDPSVATWKAVGTTHHGDVTVTLRENPAKQTVRTDLLQLATPDRLRVSRLDDAGEESPCGYHQGGSAGGSTVVPQGLLVPAHRYTCSGGGHVGVSVLHALDHHPHVCLNVAPSAGAIVRLRFSEVVFAGALVGHSGVQWVNERVPSQERTTVAFSAFGRPLGTHVHKLGSGWGGFELPTPELAGKRGELVADVGGAAQPYFCFEATTRDAAGAGGEGHAQ